MDTFQAALGSVIAAGALLACSVNAQSDRPDVEATRQPASLIIPASPEPLPDRVIDNMVRNTDRALADAKRIFFELSVDGVLTPQRVGEEIAYETAIQRGRLLQDFYKSDLDANLSVDREEVAIVATFNQPSNRFNFFEKFDSIDANGDGRASYSEFLSYSQEQDINGRRNRGSRFEAKHLLGFDQDGDGNVTEAEIEIGIQTVAADPQNIAYAKDPRARERARELAKQCLLPPAAIEDEIVLISGYEGSALSTVAVEGPEKETTVMRIVIEPGDKPLYLVGLSLEAVIWNVTGDTDRVSHFAVQRRRLTSDDVAAAGVVGLPAEKVSFVKNCGEWFKNAADGRATVAAGTISSKLGRSVDQIIASYTIGGLRVPSGDLRIEAPEPVRFPFLDMGPGDDLFIDGQGNMIAESEQRQSDVEVPPVPEGADEYTWAELYRFNPEGLVRIALEDVVAPLPLVTYDILPGQAGLLQLMQSGRMERTPDGYYRLLENIPHFPAGLNGAHRVNFLIAPGVDRPSGGGSASIFMEETGKCVTRDCYR